MAGDRGRFRWRELMAAAFAFYSKLFGWKMGEAHDMGPMDVYQLFTDGRSEDHRRQDDQAAVRAKRGLELLRAGGVSHRRRGSRAGGKVNNGPMQAPDGNWVFQGSIRKAHSATSSARRLERRGLICGRAPIL